MDTRHAIERRLPPTRGSSSNARHRIRHCQRAADARHRRADGSSAAVRSVLGRVAYESATVSVAIVDDPTIHGLNRQYLEHDYPTDVLSFVLEDDGGT